MSNSIVEAEYKEWIQDVSQRFRRSQIKAAIKVNDEMLRFYWSLGKEMDTRKEMYQWGDHFYKQISKDLKDALPGIKSFSPRILLYMHQFYRLYPDTVITPQVDAQLSERENMPQVGAHLLENSVFMIPLTASTMKRLRKLWTELSTLSADDLKDFVIGQSN